MKGADEDLIKRYNCFITMKGMKGMKIMKGRARKEIADSESSYSTSFFIGYFNKICSLQDLHVLHGRK